MFSDDLQAISRKRYIHDRYNRAGLSVKRIADVCSRDFDRAIRICHLSD